jgi:predicted transcriptional regulator
MITENNEPVGTLNRDQIIAAFPKMGRYNCRKCYEKNLIYLDVETLLEDIFELVSLINLMLVTENGQHIGVLDTENLWIF